MILPFLSAEQQQPQISAKIASPLHQPEVEAGEELLSFIHSASHGNDKQQQHLTAPLSARSHFPWKDESQAETEAQAQAHVSSPSPSEMQQHEQQTLQQQTPFEADLQESVNALMEEEEQPVAPLSPLSEAEEEQGMGRITNPRIVDVLQSSSKLQTLYKKVLARKKIGHKMSSNEDT
ncbi:uncharacterized protein LOC6588304 [Drosophila persimilis]|uniref:uncharacterized protein LOC6588304 n=1 Tax=Drosophila persimilis TaxID=7234 RepID=UPI000F081142|nr:uncharacterized protein LOC6588304 [Drosophila persimilis]